MLHRSTAAREGYTVMGALIPFVPALPKATTFGDAAEAYKVGGAKLKAKPRRATCVTVTGIPPPDPGAMSLLFLTKGLMERVVYEIELE